MDQPLFLVYIDLFGVPKSFSNTVFATNFSIITKESGWFHHRNQNYPRHQSMDGQGKSPNGFHAGLQYLKLGNVPTNLSNAHAKATAAIAHAGEQTLNAHCFADATALNDVGASLPKTF